MSRLIWDASGERFYELGVSHGVLYPVSNTGTYPSGVAWNGLTGVTENPSGAEATKLWADNINYLSLYSAEEYGATIEAYTYPDEFMECDGSATLVPGVSVSMQPRKGFGFSYRTKVGNDTIGQEFAYKLHLIYGCRASPSQRQYATINESPETVTFSWEITTTPVAVSGFKPTAHLVIDSRDFSTEAAQAKLKAFEDVLYGRNAVEATTGVEAVEATIARLPLPDEVKTLLTVTSGTTG